MRGTKPVAPALRTVIVLALSVGLGAGPAVGDEPPYTNAYAGDSCGDGTANATADASSGLLLASASVDSADGDAERACARSWIELRRDNVIPGATYRVEARLEFRGDEWSPHAEVKPFPQTQVPGSGTYAWIDAFMLPIGGACEQASGECSGGGPEIRENVACAPVLWCLDRLHLPQLQTPTELTLSAEIQMKDDASAFLKVLVWISANASRESGSDTSALAHAGATVSEITIEQVS